MVRHRASLDHPQGGAPADEVPVAVDQTRDRAPSEGVDGPPAARRWASTSRADRTPPGWPHRPPTPHQPATRSKASRARLGEHLRIAYRYTRRSRVDGGTDHQRTGHNPTTRPRRRRHRDRRPQIRSTRGSARWLSSSGRGRAQDRAPSTRPSEHVGYVSPARTGRVGAHRLRGEDRGEARTAHGGSCGQCHVIAAGQHGRQSQAHLVEQGAVDQVTDEGRPPRRGWSVRGLQLGDRRPEVDHVVTGTITSATRARSAGDRRRPPQW